MPRRICRSTPVCRCRPVAQQEIFDSEDLHEGVAAFFAKRDRSSRDDERERCDGSHRLQQQPVPDEAAGTAMLGRGAVVVWNDVAPEGRERFYAWHDKEHIPERLGIAGFRRGRRYISPGHSPEWLTLYEADDLDVLTAPAYLARLNAPTPQTVETPALLSQHVPCGVPAGAIRRIEHAAATSWRCASMRPPHARTRCASTWPVPCFPGAMALTGIVACHLLAADQAASYANTAESRTREFDVPQWIVLVEATRPDAASRARRLVDGAQLQALGGVVRADAAVYSLEISRLSLRASDS